MQERQEILLTDWLAANLCHARGDMSTEELAVLCLRKRLLPVLNSWLPDARAVGNTIARLAGGKLMSYWGGGGG
jgi:hypothetical protein